MTKLNFTLGADPEFTLHSCGKVLSAADIVYAIPGKRTDMGVKVKGGTYGHDGASSTAEIRPDPADTPKGLVENIGSILKTGFDSTAGYLDGKTSSKYASVGGHIHLEIPATYFSKRDYSSCDVRRPVRDRLNTAVVRTMACVAPLLSLDSKDTLEHRGGFGSYGNLGDRRFHNPKPGVVTLEVRCPSAEWLTTPKIAEATLTYLSVCWYEALNNPRTFSKLIGKDFLPKDTEGLMDLHRLRRSSPKLWAKFEAKLRKTVKHFELYAENKELIDYILDTKKVIADKEAVGYDINKGWGFVPDPKGVCPATFSRLSDYVPAIAASHKIYLGNEDGLGKYGDALKAVIASFRITPAHPVYLFGMADPDAAVPCVLNYTFTNGAVTSISKIGNAKLNPDSADKFGARLISRDSGLTGAAAIGIPGAWLQVMTENRLSAVVEAWKLTQPKN